MLREIVHTLHERGLNTWEYVAGSVATTKAGFLSGTVSAPIPNAYFFLSGMTYNYLNLMQPLFQFPQMRILCFAFASLDPWFFCFHAVDNQKITAVFGSLTCVLAQYAECKVITASASSVV